MHQRQGEYKKSIYYIQLALDYIDYRNSNNVAYLFLFKARAYRNLNQMEDACRAIEEGLIYAEKVSKIDVIIDLTILQVRMDIDGQSFDSAREKLHSLKKYVQSNRIKEKLGEIYLYLIELYYKTKDREKCLVYIIKAQKLHQKNISDI